MKMPKLPGGAGALRQLMEQAEQMMAQVQQFEQQMGQIRLEASAGGGVVKATVNGKGELVALTIAPEVVDPTDVEMLQDLVMSAVREAQGQAENLRLEKMRELTGGMPPGFGLP